MAVVYDSKCFRIWANKPGEDFRPVIIDHRKYGQEVRQGELSSVLTNEQAWEIVEGVSALPLEDRDDWIVAYLSIVKLEEPE